MKRDRSVQDFRSLFEIVNICTPFSPLPWSRGGNIFPTRMESRVHYSDGTQSYTEGKSNERTNERTNEGRESSWEISIVCVDSPNRFPGKRANGGGVLIRSDFHSIRFDAVSLSLSLFPPSKFKSHIFLLISLRARFRGEEKRDRDREKERKA